ncbi:MAG: hypothetical protein M9894_38610 [Planctomycetes bacterium]|nr:hypothetical protein [Planctomycetota bacterium]
MHIHRSASARRAAGLVSLALAAASSLTAAGCRDERTRLPFTSAVTPTQAVTGPTPVLFTVRDRGGQMVTVSVEVSSDEGATFLPATPVQGTPSPVTIAADPAGAVGTFEWDPIRDLGPGIHRDVVLRFSANGRDSGITSFTGPFVVDLSDRLDPITGGDALTLPVAAALPDDRVWVAGGTRGGAPQGGGFIYDPRTNAFAVAPGLPAPRARPGWALLTGGQVLVAGGEAGGLASTAAETFALTASGGSGQVTAVPGGLTFGRTAPAVAALPDGRAVVIGGASAGGVPVQTVEVFAPGVGGGSFTTAFSSGLTARVGHTATALPDGRVLVVGGVDGTGTPQQTALLIDAAATSVTTTGADVGRAEHAAVLLPDGRVLVAGGTTVLGQAANATAAAAIYDPATGQFTGVGQMARVRHRPGLAYAGGHVVAFGGAGGAPTPVAERFDFETLAWTPIAGPGTTARPDAVAVATGPGRALVVGGEAAPEVYTPDAFPAREAFDPLLTAVPAPRARHTATRLADGTVLLVGGTDGVAAGLSGVERYHPQSRTLEARAALTRGRAGHAAVAVAGGVLVVGGRDGAGLVAEAEFYDPGADRWTSAGALLTPRARATATALGDGTVLVSGGVDAAGAPLASQERWSPVTRAFTQAPALAQARSEQRAVLGPGGAAVVGPGRGAAAPTTAVDVVRPGTLTVETVPGAVARGRAGLAAPFAASAVVLVSGGEDAAGPRADAALLDLRGLGGAPPALLAGARPLVLARAAHEAVPLLDGVRVLLAGGRGPGGGVHDEGEVYDFTGLPVEQGQGRRTLDRRAVKARVDHTATLLQDGRVLLVGGTDERGVVIAGAELFVP